MPVKKSAEKALRQSKKRAALNARIKLDVTYLVKKSRKAITDKSGDASALVTKTIKAVDRAIQKGVIKRNTGARMKSRLIKSLTANKK